MLSATVINQVELSGRGIFSGQPCTARILPAQPGSGLTFVIEGQQIPGAAEFYADSPNCSVLTANGRSVSVTEHLLAALWCAGIDTALIEAEGPELPNLDGGAAWQFRSIVAAGRQESSERRQFVPDNSVCFAADPYSFIIYTPGPVLEVNYYFAHPELGVQTFSTELDRGYAAEQILPARTFITESEVTAARAAGFLQNDNEGDAVVIRDGVPGKPLLFEDEYVRHKVLDLLGDLAVVPFELTGRITACRSGHSLNRKLACWLANEAAVPG